MWKGIIIKESLLDSKVLWETQLLKITLAENGWHLHTVFCEKKTIPKIQQKLKPKFFARFWNNKKIVVAFSDKLFEFEQEDAETRKKAIAHGEKKGVPKEQLDFPTN